MKADLEMSSNVTPDLIAEALALYTEDKGLCGRATMKLARNQKRYERMGVSAHQIRKMYKEAQLTHEERQEEYANELRYRIAVSLWDAETESDFDQAMEAASRTEQASHAAADGLFGARAYNDGFNGALKGKQTAGDNPHDGGTLLHVSWDKGCRDGLVYLDALDGGDGAPKQITSGNGATHVSNGNGAAEAANGVKKRGRPTKEATAARLAAERQVALEAEDEPHVSLLDDGIDEHPPSMPH